jgi:hypothetical protein
VVELPSPVEDFVSIAALALVPVPTRMLLSVGFGVDAHVGVCHAQVLRAIAELTQSGGYLGAISLLSDMPEVAAYLDAVSYANERSASPSIVSSSIAAAIAGHFGDHHSSERTRGTRLFINPLMPIYWFFDLPKVAERILFLDRLEGTETWEDVQETIADFLRGLPARRAWEEIPL